MARAYSHGQMSVCVMENADVGRNTGMEWIHGKMVRCTLDLFMMASSMDMVSHRLYYVYRFINSWWVASGCSQMETLFKWKISQKFHTNMTCPPATIIMSAVATFGLEDFQLPHPNCPYHFVCSNTCVSCNSQMDMILYTVGVSIPWIVAWLLTWWWACLLKVKSHSFYTK